MRLARTSAQCAGVRLAYPEPQRMGVDRFLALLGARALGGEALVLVGGGGEAIGHGGGNSVTFSVNAR